MEFSLLIRITQIIIGIVGVCSVNLFAQFTLNEITPEWQKVVGWTGDDEITDAVIDPLGFYVVTGSIQTDEIFGDNILLRKIDPVTKEITYRNYGGPGVEKAKSILTKRGGGFIVGGYSQTARPTAKGARDALIMGINQSLVATWIIEEGTAENDEVVKLLALPQSYVALIQFGERPALLEFDEKGIILSRRDLNQPGYVIRDGLIADNGMMILLMTNGQSERAISMIMVVDGLEGQISRISVAKKLIQELTSIQYSDHPNELYLAGNRYRKNKGSDIVLFKYDTQSQSIDEIATTGGRWDEKVTDLVILPDGKAVISGSTRSHVRNARRDNVLISIYDPKDNSFSNSTIGDVQNEKVNKLIHSATGELMIFGQYRRDGWIAKAMQIEQADLALAEISSVKVLSEPDDTDKTYYQGSQEELELVLEIEGSLPTSIRCTVVDPEVAGLELPGEITFYRTENYRALLPIHVLDSCQSGDYTVEIRVEAISDNVQVPLKQEIKVRPVPFYELSMQSTELSLIDAGKDLYELSFAVKNEGNMVIEDAVMNVFFPPYVQLVTDATKRFEHNPGESETFSFQFSIRRQEISGEIEIRYNVSSDIEGVDVNNTFYVNAIEIIDQLEQAEISRLTTEIPRPQIEIAAEPYRPVAPIVDLTWQYPFVERESETISSQRSELVLRLRISSNIDLEKEDVVLSVNGNGSIEDVLYNVEDEEFYFTDSQGDQKYFTYKNQLNLLSGNNQIDIYVLQEGDTIRRSSFNAFYDPPKSKLHVFSVGIPYTDTQYALKYTGKDAQELASAFKLQQGKLFNEVTVHLLTDTDKTKAQSLAKYFVENTAEAYSDGFIRNEDMVIVYLSAHGFIDPVSGIFRIAASDFDHRTINFTSLDYQTDIFSQLEKIPCKKVIFLDACHSGSIVSSNVEIGSKNMAMLSRLNLGKALEELADAGNNTYVISSSSGDQLSYEDDAWENSSFVEAILSALKNESYKVNGREILPDADQNEVLYLSELYSYIRERVPEMVSKVKSDRTIRQVPFMEIQEERDLPIYYMGSP